MTLRPILNPNNPPKGDMFDALNWFETLCRMRGVTEVSEADVRRHLAEEEKRPDLAEAFVRAYFCELPAEPR